MRRLPLPFVAAVTAFVSAPAIVSADCPVTDMQFNAEGVFHSAAAEFDTVVSATKELGYDIPAGTLRMKHERKFSSFVNIHDTFVASGVAMGTPVLAVLEFVADGTVSTPGCGGSNCWGYLGATILAEGSTAQESDPHNVFAGMQPAHVDLAVPILFVAGQPKEIAIALSGSGSADHFVAATGSFHFTALPAGVSITSCRGYEQAPTPATASTWGAVKAAYR